MRCFKCVKILQHATIPSHIWDGMDINAKNILAYLITFLSPSIRYLFLRFQHADAIDHHTTLCQSSHHATPVCLIWWICSHHATLVWSHHATPISSHHWPPPCHAGLFDHYITPSWSLSGSKMQVCVDGCGFVWFGGCGFVLVVGLGCGFVWFGGFGMWVCECGGLLWIFYLFIFFIILRWHWWMWVCAGGGCRWCCGSGCWWPLLRQWWLCRYCCWWWQGGVNILF